MQYCLSGLKVDNINAGREQSPPCIFAWLICQILNVA